MNCPHCGHDFAPAVQALTSRQHAIYAYIVAFTEQHGYSPSLEEIGAKFEYGSLSTVHEHLATTLVEDALQVSLALERGRCAVWSRSRTSPRSGHPAIRSRAEIRPGAQHRVLKVLAENPGGVQEMRLRELVGVATVSTLDALVAGDLATCTDRRRWHITNAGLAELGVHGAAAVAAVTP